MRSIFVKFMLEPDAVLSSKMDTVAHQRFISCWKHYGVLFCDQDDSSSNSFREMVETLPQKIRPLWKKAWKRNRKRQAPKHWCHPEGIEKLDELKILQGHIDLLCLEETRTDLLVESIGLGHNDSYFYVTDADIEISKFEAADQSKSFQEALRISEERINVGMKVISLWHQRFQPLVDSYMNIWLVDRYALKHHSDFLEGWHGQPSGLETFVNRIGSHKEPHSLTIYTAEHDFLSKEEMTSHLEELVNRYNVGGFRSVILYTLKDKQFGAIAHDRHLRFHRTVITLGSGIEVLSANEVRRPCDFQLKRSCEEFEDTETRLQCYSDKAVIL